MKIDGQTVIRAAELAGAAMPAAKALLDIVRPFLSPAEQDELKRTLAQEWQDSEDAHRATQEELQDPGA